MSNQIIDEMVSSMQFRVRYAQLVEDPAFGLGAGNSGDTTKKQWMKRKKTEIKLVRECVKGVQL